MLTFVPTVSCYKLGKLEKVATNSQGCILSITLRNDFKFDDEEEARMMEIVQNINFSTGEHGHTNGYLGQGRYRLSLKDFAECHVEVQQPGLRARVKSMLEEACKEVKSKVNDKTVKEASNGSTIFQQQINTGDKVRPNRSLVN